MPDLYPHQRAEVQALRNMRRGLLLSETGTGKTPVLLTLAAEALARGERVWWVTEAGLVRQAQEEANDWLPQGASMPVAMEKAKPTDRFVITTHGKIQSRIDTLQGVSPDLLIVDEAAVVGGGGAKPQAKTYGAIREFTHRSQRSVFATATPVSTTHALDLWALLDAAAIPNTPSRSTLMRYITTAEIPNRWGGTTRVPVGITDAGLSLLTRAVAGASIRSTVQDTQRTLPNLRRQYLDVSLTASDREAYVHASGVAGLEGHQLRQAASRSQSALIPATLQYLRCGEGFNHDKVIVFTENFDLLTPLERELRAASEPVLTLEGKMTSKQRASVIDWQKEEGRRILLGTEAMETGLNLQHCSLLVSVVQTWNPSRERQREGRLVRIGSLHPEVLHVVIRSAVSIESWKTYKHDVKQAIAARVLAAVPSSDPERRTGE
jgi:superfamily II DNA or RNA helicase